MQSLLKTPRSTERTSMTPVLAWAGPLVHEAAQRALNWLTGRPRDDDQPLFRWTARGRELAAWVTLASGLLLSAGAFTSGSWMLALAPLGFLLTVGALRAMYIEIAHNAVHGAHHRDPARDRRTTDFYTALTLMNPSARFYAEHVRGHHAHTTTSLDPDRMFLLDAGFKPGMSVAQLWRRYWLTFFDLRFHLRVLGQRLGANFSADVPLPRRAAAALALLAPPAIAAWTGLWAFYALAWLLPLTYGFQQSMLLQMLGGEHLWGQDFGRGRYAIAAQTYGRFLGEPYPAIRGLPGLWAKTRWYLRFGLFHLPVRIAIYVGHDLGPAHDLHHRDPLADWPNAPYERLTRQQSGSPGWPLPYHDHWASLLGHTNRVLEGLAASPALPKD
jgi:Fatty acid desaturase